MKNVVMQHVVIHWILVALFGQARNGDISARGTSSSAKTPAEARATTSAEVTAKADDVDDRPDQAPVREPVAQAVDVSARSVTAAEKNLPLDGVTAAVAMEIRAVDSAHRSIRTNQQVALWQFGTVRSSYEAILNRAGGDPAVEEAIRVRLARVTRDEQAAQAARTIDDILARSHRRDAEVAAQKRRVAAAGRSARRSFSAVGYMQASTEKIDGRILYVLIGKDGSTLAYLDIPPGLDVERLVAHRVGVRGDPHYDEELGSRLITVRDLEKIEARR